MVLDRLCLGAPSVAQMNDQGSCIGISLLLESTELRCEYALDHTMLCATAPACPVLPGEILAWSSREIV